MPDLRFVTDDEGEIAFRTDLIRAIWLVVEGDTTQGRVELAAPEEPHGIEVCDVREDQARQIIRRLA